MFKIFIVATYLKQIVAIYKKISFCRHLHGRYRGHLVDEERFAHGSNVDLWRKRIHKIGVSEIDFFRIDQSFVILKFSCEKVQNFSLIQFIEEGEESVSGCAHG